MASKGGSDAPPAWYLNLSENPEVEVQVKGDSFKARARTASAEEKPEMWQTMASEWPDYDEYQRSTDARDPGRGARAQLSADHAARRRLNRRGILEAGCHSSTRLPPGSVTQPIDRRPPCPASPSHGFAPSRS